MTWHVLNNPIDPGQLTEMPFGVSSYWLQPWRSSLETQPATSLQNAIGVNFDVTPQESSDTARLLHDSGFRRARLEISWNHMSYANPSQLADAASWTPYITAFRDNDIRPLILLNANDGGPVPMTTLKLTLRAPAAQGARTVSLSSGSAAQVVPGLTGIDEDGVVAKVLITSVDALDIATLSQPLPASLGAGPVAAATLRYEPFAPPYLANGAPNPRFEQTLSGWLTYVKGVADFVRSVYGSDNFDVEVWNELSFGSDFLSESNYYNPVPDPGSTGDVTNALLQATIQMLHDPANGLSDVQVGDGFSNQEPFTSGTTVPPGTAAIDKHYYVRSMNIYPGSPTESGIQPVDAQGQPAPNPNGVVQHVFTPTFRAFFPEFYLTGIKTETLMRDLSPIQTSIFGTPHGADTHPVGSPPPTLWMTEDNLDQTEATANGLPAGDLQEFQAKAAMRFYVSYASEGMQAIDLFAAKGGACCQMIPQAFFNAVDKRPGIYPGRLGGLTMRAVGRLTSTLSAAQQIVQPRQLTLDAIAQYGDDSQFTGNGTSAFPNLYNRDVLAFFPFQVSENRFVAAVYVMTRDLTQHYTSSPAPGQTAYDLPPEEFRLTIGNVDAAHATVSLTDPLTGTQQPAAIVSRNGSEIEVQLAATDSPRMLTIDDGPSATAPPGTSPVSTSPPGTAPGRRSRPAALTLKTPVKVSAVTVLDRGIKLLVGCGRPCSIHITASRQNPGAAHASTYGEAIARPRTRSTVYVTLKLDSRGRAWLRTRRPTRLRITARDSFGAVVSKVIDITYPHVHKVCRKHGRHVNCRTVHE